MERFRWRSAVFLVKRVGLLVCLRNLENRRNHKALKVRKMTKNLVFCAYGYGSELFQNAGLLTKRNVNNILIY